MGDQVDDPTRNYLTVNLKITQSDLKGRSLSYRPLSRPIVERTCCYCLVFKDLAPSRGTPLIGHASRRCQYAALEPSLLHPCSDNSFSRFAVGRPS